MNNKFDNIIELTSIYQDLIKISREALIELLKDMPQKCITFDKSNYVEIDYRTLFAGNIISMTVSKISLNEYNVVNIELFDNVRNITIDLFDEKRFDDITIIKQIFPAIINKFKKD